MEPARSVTLNHRDVGQQLRRITIGRWTRWRTEEQPTPQTVRLIKD